MRRMVNTNAILQRPVLIFEDEITNNSSVNVELAKGDYLIQLHQKDCACVALLHVGEENRACSTSTLFNSGVTGTSMGVYQYDALGTILELVDGTENTITVSGHIDIYRFKGAKE